MTYAVAYVQITTYICNVIRKTISQTDKEIKVMKAEFYKVRGTELEEMVKRGKIMKFPL